VADNSDEEESADEKPPPIKQVLEVFQVLNSEIQQRTDFDDQHKAYEEMIKKRKSNRLCGFL